MSRRARTSDAPGTLALRSKPGGYYANPRADLVATLTRPLGRVLDIGCGEGGAGAPLAAAGARWVAGIEIMPEAAARAAERYDQVEVGNAVEVLDRLDGRFDTILCYDVLEHLVDPAALLEKLHDVRSPTARLHVSVPNARHISLLIDLVFRGTFGYAESGHRDATHLRWFTRRDIEGLVNDSGWKVASTTPSLRRFPWISRPLHVATRGRSTEFLTLQWFVLALAP